MKGSEGDEEREDEGDEMFHARINPRAYKSSSRQLSPFIENPNAAPRHEASERRGMRNCFLGELRLPSVRYFFAPASTGLAPAAMAKRCVWVPRYIVPFATMAVE